MVEQIPERIASQEWKPHVAPGTDQQIAARGCPRVAQEHVPMIAYAKNKRPSESQRLPLELLQGGHCGLRSMIVRDC